MPTITKRADDEFAQAIDGLRTLSASILRAFSKGETSTRNVIVGNFIARSITTVDSVFALWRAEHYQDCWILHRALMDRLFHLQHLIDTNTFEEFDEWSFVQQIEANHRLKSDPEFAAKTHSEDLATSSAQLERYRQLKKRGISWRRPRAEDMAKKMEMPFLYRYGYDYASSHVHPMANDGQQDFYRIAGLESSVGFPEQMAVIINTVLVATMVVQTGLNGSGLRWRAIVYDALEQIRQYVGGDCTDYAATLKRLLFAEAAIGLSETQ
jgi:hypothetical protein